MLVIHVCHLVPFLGGACPWCALTRRTACQLLDLPRRGRLAVDGCRHQAPTQSAECGHLPRVVHRAGLRDNQVLVTVDPFAGHVQVTRVGGGLEQEPEQALTNVREPWKGKIIL